MSSGFTSNGGRSIQAIDGSSVHRITSGQVVIDLQTAVKELVENSLDAGANSIDIRFKNYGLKSIEVVDNGSGISEKDFDSIGRKHHTSKLSAFYDLTTLTSFGFRGEALSSLCAVCEGVTVTTATSDKAPMGATLQLDKRGEIESKAKGVRQRGTTILLTSLFAPLPVRRKELERNIKREFSKSLALLYAYALGPCCGLGSDRAVRFSVTNQPDKGYVYVRTGTTALWGPKALDGVIDLDLEFEVLKKSKGQHRDKENVDLGEDTFKIQIKGLISSPTPIPGSGSTPRPGNSGRSATDRQFFYVNGRPCTLNKIQKAINDIYRTFVPSNATSGQFPFVVADFTIPGDTVDVNVTPDKRTILVHAEAELCDRMKDGLEKLFSPSRSTYGVNGTQLSKSTSMAPNQGTLPFISASAHPSVDTQASQGQDAEEEGTQSIPLVENLSTSSDFEPLNTGRREDAFPFTNASGAETTMDIDHLRVPLSPPRSHQHSSNNSQPPEPPYSPRLVKPLPEPRTVVMSTTQASWNRPKNSFGEPVSLSMEPSRDTRQKETPVESAISAYEDDFDSGIEPPRKKRKSAAAFGEHMDTDADDDDNAVESTQEPPEQAKKVFSREINIRTTRSVPTSQQAKLSDIFVGKTSRQEMRTQLAGFARNGSQVVHNSLDMEEEEEEDEEAEAKADQIESRKTPEGTENEYEIRNFDQTSRALFLPNEDDDDSSMIVDASDDLFVVPTGTHRNTSPSSSLSVLSRVTTPPASNDNSLLLISSKNANANHLHAENEFAHRPEVIRTENSQSSVEDVRLRFNVSELTERWTNLYVSLHEAKLKLDLGDKQEKISSSSLAEDAGVSAVDAPKSEAALSRVIIKSDFKEMEVLGQFNLGFIIVRRRKKRTLEELEDSVDEHAAEILDDLFIVDQHAADEKYNFETLQQTTNIKSQRLLQPRPLELTASDELLALENLDVLKLNGFELEVGGDTQEVGDDIEMRDDNRQSPTYRQLRLVAQPVSKSTVFDMRDLEELIQLLHDRSTGQTVRCSKARAMFAMRACRKSVMIGMPLTKSQMSTVVTHMGTMNQPWNCPHGRPTMRHLIDMTNLQPSRQKNHLHRKVNWTDLE
ncbi:DNA mismatch repair protein [Lentinula aciculospora]|uniref:DNA mismatch repair protein n=1 Tax=Lentinula aciculospora TaxID=153920 RepID=A0A9W9AGP8_9AGAR|nr:DNA mismatch repair protein [Lentinula aciculospora]